jgi:hypothetical protein
VVCERICGAHSLSFAAAPLVQVAGMLGYSNEDNPFGDTNLSQQFVWNKKLQKEQMETKSGGVLCGPVWSCVALVSAYHRPDPTPCPYPASCCPCHFACRSQTSS